MSRWDTYRAWIEGIAKNTPEQPEERDDPLVSVSFLEATGHSLVFDPSLNKIHCGLYRLRQAYRILQAANVDGETNFFLQ